MRERVFVFGLDSLNYFLDFYVNFFSSFYYFPVSSIFWVQLLFLLWGLRCVIIFLIWAFSSFSTQTQYSVNFPIVQLLLYLIDADNLYLSCYYFLGIFLFFP